MDYLNPDGSEGELVGASVEDCITACPLELGCVGFKRKPNETLPRPHPNPSSFIPTLILRVALTVP